MPGASFDPERQFDLTAVAGKLDQDKRHPRITSLIRRAISASSAHEDLKEAEACLRTLNRLSDDDGDLKLDDRAAASIAGSLFDHAVVLYMRATETASKVRRGWWGIEMLSPELRETHELIKALRNEAIAHFGYGEGIPVRPIVREVLVLQFVGNSPVTTFYVSRVHNRADISARLGLLIAAMKEVARGTARARMTEVIEAIAHIGKEDASLKDLIISQRFIPAEFFVGNDAQQEISSSMDDQGVGTMLSSVAVPKPPRRKR